jgi:hypothetical protein
MDVVAKQNGGGKAHLYDGKRGRAASTTKTTTSRKTRVSKRK